MRLSRLDFKPPCKKCPLQDRQVVKACGPAPRSFLSGLVILGEAPGEQEDRQGEPFVGPAGGLLNRLLRQAGSIREACWITNVLPCRPEKNEISSPQAQEALQLCRPAFEAEIRKLKALGARAILALGQTALDACGVRGSITTRRGYVYSSRFGLPVVPSYHPAFVLRGNADKAPVVVSDMQKALEIAKTGWKEPRFQMNLFPSIKDLREFSRRVVSQKALLGVDIETTSLLPHKGALAVVGLADSAESALVVPFLGQGYRPYWSAREEKEAIDLLQKIFSSCRLVFHNALFDVGFLEAKGFSIQTIEHDTMILHHFIHPEMFSRLSFVASIYDNVPYWKDTLEDKETASMNLPDQAFREYNAKDSIELLRILPGLIQDAEILEVYEPYKALGLALIRPVLRMYQRGVLLSQARLKAWNQDLTDQSAELLARLRSRLGLPDAFNPSSPQHLAWVLYGEIPSRVQVDIETFEALEDSFKDLSEEKVSRKKATKKYSGLKQTYELFKACKISHLPSQAPRHKTDKNGLALDETALESLLIWIRSDPARRKKFSNLEGFLEDLLAYRAVSKLLSTYGEFSVWPDGRVHFPYKITGTVTGRLSSGDKKNLNVGNAQNIPDEARRLFIAPPGWVLIGADYASLEPRMLAYLSQDEPLIRDFAAGVKIYDGIIRDVLGLEKSDPAYKAIRDAVKVYVLATNYGGSLQTVYRNMKLKCKDLPFSFKDVEEIHRKRLALHPAYKAYYDELVKTVTETRVLRNAFGRRRVFLGDSKNIIREALDYGPQSSGADLVNQAMIRIDQRLLDETSQAGIVLQLHDAMYLEAPLQEAQAAARILQEEMERPVDILDYKAVSFPVELKVGASWGEMVEIKSWQDCPSSLAGLRELLAKESFSLPEEWQELVDKKTSAKRRKSYAKK